MLILTVCKGIALSTRFLLKVSQEVKGFGLDTLQINLVLIYVELKITLALS